MRSLVLTVRNPGLTPSLDILEFTAKSIEKIQYGQLRVQLSQSSWYFIDAIWLATRTSRIVVSTTFPGEKSISRHFTSSSLSAVRFYPYFSGMATRPNFAGQSNSANYLLYLLGHQRYFFLISALCEPRFMRNSTTHYASQRCDSFRRNKRNWVVCWSLKLSLLIKSKLCVPSFSRGPRVMPCKLSRGISSSLRSNNNFF